jgi:hypothetical protein
MTLLQVNKTGRFVDKLGRNFQLPPEESVIAGATNLSISEIRFSYIFMKGDRLPVY